MRKILFLLLVMICFTACQQTMRIGGRVIDSSTEKPISNAKIKVRGAFRKYPAICSLLTSNDGTFIISVPIDTLRQPLELKVSKDNYDVQRFIFEKSKRRRIYQLGDIELAYIAFGWPISDSIRSLPPLRIYDTEMLPYTAKPVRTIRPPCFPSSYYKRLPDSSGGEWVVFAMPYESSVYFVSYMNPDGSMERCCPVGEPWILGEITLQNDTLIVNFSKNDGGQIKYMTQPYTIEELRKDSDSDSLPDLYEERYCLNPLSRDSDNDGLDDLNDPFPNIAAKSPPNDTSLLLQKCFDEEYYYNCFGSNQLDLVIWALPKNDSLWIDNLMSKLRKKYTADFYILEIFLTHLNPSQLRKMYPLLKSISMKSCWPGIPLQELNNEVFYFPYLELLKNANEENLMSIRRKIMWTFSQYFVIPFSVEGDIAQCGIGSLPFVANRIYLTNCMKNYASDIQRRIFSIRNMDSTAAVMVIDDNTMKYEWIFIKRDGNWVKVASRQEIKSQRN